MTYIKGRAPGLAHLYYLFYSAKISQTLWKFSIYSYNGVPPLHDILHKVNMKYEYYVGNTLYPHNIGLTSNIVLQK